MPSVKDQVVVKLLGTTAEQPAAKETRASFMKHAERDEQTDEWYLDEDHFINAITPDNEDYVSRRLPGPPNWLCSH
jgi:solute carrier family 25 (mitochondrial aspartate/glutamate transporter), member 12/13